MVQEGFLPSPRSCCYEFLCALQETIKTEKAVNPKVQRCSHRRTGICGSQNGTAMKTSALSTTLAEYETVDTFSV